MKKLSVSGKCTDGSCDPIDLVLTIKATGDVTDFGNHIKWSLYKANSSEDSYSCDNALQTGVGTVAEENTTATSYFYKATCTGDNNMNENLTTEETTSKGTGSYEYSGTLTDTSDHVALIEDVTGSTDDTYYLVVEYENDSSANQNSEQGKTFTVELDVAPQA